MKNIAHYMVSLKVFLKNNKGEVLILNTLTPDSFYGKYDFPGGRIDKDEFQVDLKDILKREIEEEVGNLEVNIGIKPVAVSRNLSPKDQNSSGEDQYVFYSFWEAEILSGELEISEEHNGFAWLKLEDIVLEDYFSSGMLEAVKMYLNK